MIFNLREVVIRLQHRNKMLWLQQKGTENERIEELQEQLEQKHRKMNELETKQRWMMPSFITITLPFNCLATESWFTEVENVIVVQIIRICGSFSCSFFISHYPLFLADFVKQFAYSWISLMSSQMTENLTNE